MEDEKVVEIVCVGTELLLGNIINTNAAFLAEECAKLGLSNYYQTVVGDNETRLESTLRLALSRSDIVILSGGLGPTEDDLTKEVCVKVAEKSTYRHEESYERLVKDFEKRGLKLTDNNLKMVEVPADSEILVNENGNAPGMIIPVDNKFIVLLPGPPVELKPMFLNQVVPFVQKLSNRVFVSSTVKIVSVVESNVEEMIKDLVDNQTNPTIATYAKGGEVHIRVTASGKDNSTCEKLIKPVVRELKNRFGSNIYTTHSDVTLEKAVVDLLASGELRAMTVESCTAGMVAARIVNVPGASEVFKYGLVTYSNKAKRKLAGVKKSTLNKYTAVSEETAREMVKGTEIGPKADVIVGVTGYASQGDETQPAGLVYIACNVCGNTKVKEFHFNGSREKVRINATTQALVLMRECILEYLSEQTFKQQ